MVTTPIIYYMIMNSIITSELGMHLISITGTFEARNSIYCPAFGKVTANQKRHFDDLRIF